MNLNRELEDQDDALKSNKGYLQFFRFVHFHHKKDEYFQTDSEVLQDDMFLITGK